MPLRPRFPAALLAACVSVAVSFAISAAAAADVQPRPYAWLMAHSDLVVSAKVVRVSIGLFGGGHTATLQVDGIAKGRWSRPDLEVSWDEAAFPEAGYTRDSRVIVFAVLRKDSTYGQAAPGISCWPVERIKIRGRTARAAEYAYPLDLLTQVPAKAMAATETMEQSLNFRVAKRKQWILVDKLLPRFKPLNRPKPASPSKRRPRAKSRPAG